MNMKNMMFSAIMVSAIFPHSFVSAHHSHHRTTKIGKTLLGMTVTGALASGGGVLGTVVGAFTGGCCGWVKSALEKKRFEGDLSEIGRYVAWGAGTGAVSGGIVGLAIAKVFYDEINEEDSMQCKCSKHCKHEKCNKEELVEELKKSR